jgi:membrane peptidoglycan carboxypeptidase
VRPSDAHRSKTAAVALLVIVSMLSGVLVAGLIAPLVGGLGIGERALAATITIPVAVEQGPLAQRTRILAKDGSLIADFYDENRTEVTLSQVNTITINALLAVEDARFYDHHGIDVQGILRALVKNSASGDVQAGGSTITQQYIKNVLLNSATTDAERQAATGQSLKRKINEARAALALEKVLTKNQILERYLNIAYFGAGAYGIGTAAQRFFSKPVSKLTLSESALLMGLVQNPAGYDPTRRPARALERRNVVLQRMRDVNFITDGQLAAAKAEPLGLNPKTIPNGCTNSKYAGFCHYVEETILTDPQFGATREERQNLLRSGGVTIRTTLDPKVQNAAQAAIDETVAAQATSKGGRIGAALATVEPGTGRVLALAQNQPYGQNKGQTTILYSTGTGAKNADGSPGVGNQAGSTFKMFTLVAALKAGLPLSTAFKSPAKYPPNPDICDAPHNSDGDYFQNAGDSEAGTFDMWSGTAKSVNTYYVQLEQALGGINSIVQVAKDMGVPFRGQLSKLSNKSCSFTLGITSEWPLDIAGAYATLAAHGKYCETRQVAPAQCTQVIITQVADTAAAVLEGPLQPGGTAAQFGQIGRPAAGKTGTTDGNSDAWFTGFVPQMATSVWLGHTDRVSVLDGLRTLNPDEAWGPSVNNPVFGGGIPTIIWSRMMSAALADVPIVPLPPADPVLSHGVSVLVPGVTGLQPSQATAVLQQEGLTATISTTPVASALPKGVVVSTTPGAGAKVPTGSLITLILSTGVPPPPPTPTPTPTPTPSETPPTGPIVTPTPDPSGSPNPSPGVSDTATAGPAPGLGGRSVGKPGGKKKH